MYIYLQILRLTGSYGDFKWSLYGPNPLKFKHEIV